jgi:hypothetical protein
MVVILSLPQTAFYTWQHPLSVDLPLDAGATALGLRPLARLDVALFVWFFPMFPPFLS